MKQKVGLLLAGVLVGALLMTVLPVSAHHGDDFRSLRRRVNVLEDRTQFMRRNGVYNSFIFDGQVLSECGEGSGAVWAISPQFKNLRALSCAGGPTAFKASERAVRSFKASHR